MDKDSADLNSRQLNHGTQVGSKTGQIIASTKTKVYTISHIVHNRLLSKHRFHLSQSHQLKKVERFLHKPKVSSQSNFRGIIAQLILHVLQIRWRYSQWPWRRKLLN